MAVQFGSGELSGAMGYDDVYFGDTLKVKQFGFYLIAQENNILQNVNSKIQNDGLGLFRWRHGFI